MIHAHWNLRRHDSWDLYFPHWHVLTLEMDIDLEGEVPSANLVRSHSPPPLSEHLPRYLQYRLIPVLRIESVNL